MSLHLTRFLALLSTTVVLTGCIEPSLGSPSAGARRGSHQGLADKRLMRAEFRVTGASCLSCLKEIESLIKKDSGVKSVSLSYSPPFKALVVYDRASTNPDRFLASMRKAGYNIADLTTSLAGAPRKVADPIAEYRRLMNLSNPILGE